MIDRNDIHNIRQENHQHKIYRLTKLMTNMVVAILEKYFNNGNKTLDLVVKQWSHAFRKPCFFRFPFYFLIMERKSHFLFPLYFQKINNGKMLKKEALKSNKLVIYVRKLSEIRKIF